MHAPAASLDRHLCAGRVIALASDDARRLSDFMLALHDLVSLPLQIAAALYLLYTQIQLAFLAGLVIAVALIPLNKLLAAAVGRASARMLSHKDARLDRMATFLSNLRSIYMLGWQHVVTKQVRMLWCCAMYRKLVCRALLAVSACIVRAWRGR